MFQPDARCRFQQTKRFQCDRLWLNNAKHTRHQGKYLCQNLRAVLGIWASTSLELLSQISKRMPHRKSWNAQGWRSRDTIMHKGHCHGNSRFSDCGGSSRCQYNHLFLLQSTIFLVQFPTACHLHWLGWAFCCYENQPWLVVSLRSWPRTIGYFPPGRAIASTPFS